ncbi:uncharacterized protein NEMAJ01_1847 [Nematocida major]|uniref:uncharacterized protein n=1 Tax=Nematocida major TaxID=1912982 RepID=UPI0020088C0E|nr:uncharacterized protein NEMAJ01_1847 [Nematocida major]KAH9386951.1 hypothetical protein NEMAJ01_1847 [Nematocida major]
MCLVFIGAQIALASESHQIEGESDLSRTIRVLSHENTGMSVENIEFRISEDGLLHAKNPALQSISITLENYAALEPSVKSFDACIVYKNIKIQGRNGPLGYAEKKAQMLLFMRFLDAFQDIKADEICVQDLVFKEEHPPVPERLPARRPVPAVYSASVRKIVFVNVSSSVFVGMLKKYTFGAPVELEFRNCREATWDSLAKLPKSIRYARISIDSIGSTKHISSEKRKKLQRIMPVVEISSSFEPDQCPPEESSLSCAPLRPAPEEACAPSHINKQEIPAAAPPRALPSIKGVSIRTYAEASAERKKELSTQGDVLVLLVNDPSDLRIEGPEHLGLVRSMRAPFSSGSLKSQIEALFDPIGIGFHTRHFARDDRPENFRVNIRFARPQSFSLDLLKETLKWAVAQVGNVSDLTVSNLSISGSDLVILGSIKACVEDLSFLNHFCLQSSNRENAILVLKNADYAESTIPEQIELNPQSMDAVGLPLSLYLRNGFVKKGCRDPQAVLRVEYPGEESAEALTVCMTCIINVFAYKASGPPPTSTRETVSVQELENMSWGEFCAHPNKDAIAAHLVDACTASNSPDVTEENFECLRTGLCEKPIFIMPECKHTICMNCLSSGQTSLCIFDPDLIQQAHVQSIKCPLCRKISLVTWKIQYPIYAEKRDFLNRDMLYTLEGANTPRANGAAPVECAFYLCKMFEKEEYYTHALPYLTKQAVFIGTRRTFSLFS